jgi:D-galactarolactone cycloisomerase
MVDGDLAAVLNFRLAGKDNGRFLVRFPATAFGPWAVLVVGGLRSDDMAKITAIELIPLMHRLPEGRSYGMARGLAVMRQTTIVQLVTDVGVIGIGEACGPPKVTRAYCDLIAPYFVGRSVYHFEHVVSVILSTHYHLGVQNQMMACLSGIDAACLDVAGKLQGLPVADLIGGRAKSAVPVYVSGGYLTEDSISDFPAQLDHLAATGARRVKIKIGISPASDVERVAAARAVLGEGVDLIVDANGNYTVDEALESMRRIADHRVYWYEEPLPPQDFDGYAALRGKALMPIATGEALYTAWDFKRLLELRGADVVQPDLTLCGGIHAGREVALLARLNHTRLSPHVWGGAVGLATACHFVASIPDYPHSRHVVEPTLVEYEIGENPLREEIVCEPLLFADGALAVPDRPGLGVELEPTAIRRYRIDQ